MPLPCRRRLTAVLPCNNLDVAESFFTRLGFMRTEENKAAGYDTHRILVNEDGEDIHLTDCPEGWLVPGRNPFGLYLYVEDVDAVAAKMEEFIIEKGKKAEHKSWGMYEVNLNGPDETLVRVGWPSGLIK